MREFVLIADSKHLPAHHPLPTVNEHLGYRSGERYGKRLRYVEESSGGRTVNVILEDEKGIRLLWSTTKTTKGYQKITSNAIWRFSVSQIIHPNVNIPLPYIHIHYLDFME